MMWGNENQAIEGITFFERDFTWQEEQEYYRHNFSFTDSDSVSNLFGLYNDMNIGDASHEMWNAWVGYDFYEMNSRLREEEIILIGICDTPPYNCIAFGTKSCDYIAEDKVTGNRFWSHGSIEWVHTMRQNMQDTYNELLKE